MASKIHLRLPILSWLPGYRRAWLARDVVAGVTVVALLVPEGMAYAQIAGLPPHTAFYAAPIGLLMYAMFGTSRQLVVAVSAAVATVSHTAVSAHAEPGTPEFVILTSALALLAGAVSVLAGLCRLGGIARLVSTSVMAGFVAGLSFIVAIRQVPKLLGVPSSDGNFWMRLYDVTRHLGGFHPATALVAAGCLALLALLERRLRRVPAALVVLIVAIVVSRLAGLEAIGVHVVGPLPTGLAPLRVPDVNWLAYLGLLPVAVGLALFTFAEALGPAHAIAARHEYGIDLSQELVALGAANAGAGLFQAFPIGASLSKSAACDRANGQTQVAGLVAAAVTAMVAVFAAPLLYHVPQAALAAIVVVAVAGMVNVSYVRPLYAARRQDFALAVLTFLGVLTLRPLWGLAVAVVASLAASLLRRESSA